MRFLNFLTCHGKKVAKAEGGVALIEFALSASLLIILLIGGVELSRYVLIIQKLEKSVSEIADVVTQTNGTTSTVQDSDLLNDTSAVQFMMYPYYTAGIFDGVTPNLSAIIITDISRSANNGTTCTDASPCYKVNWQYCGGMNAAGTISVPQLSRVAPSGGAPQNTGMASDIINDLGNTGSPLFGFSFAAGEEIVVTEYFYNFKPILVENLVPRTLIYRYAIYMPRIGSLTTPPPAPSTSQCSS